MKPVAPSTAGVCLTASLPARGTACLCFPLCIMWIILLASKVQPGWFSPICLSKPCGGQLLTVRSRLVLEEGLPLMDSGSGHISVKEGACDVRLCNLHRGWRNPG